MRDIIRNKYIYLMLLPTIIFYIVFHYIPMYGVLIAFKDYKASRGILGSPWAGLKYFKQFFGSYYAWRLIRNTLLISVYQLIFSFPAPILLALLLNELKSEKFKRTVQTVSYLPHFISTVVVVGFIVDFFAQKGLVNTVLASLGVKPISFLMEPKWFRPLYIGSGIWKGIGWNSIIYLAAISGIDPTLYEAATVDGAGRFKQIMNVTIPSIMPTIIILLILQIGNMMSVGYQKIILMYNESIYETADVISTFVYRSGLQKAQYSYAAAIGLFNNIINFALIITANYISRRVSETSLW
ncbi:MAG: sugar ABC transporter permease [Clostridiales bacterium]|nr:sugar ABC transporter permease [Clostridiales bacterium]